MRTRYTWVLVGLLGCTKAGPQQDSVEPPPKQPTFAQPPGARMPPPPPAPAPVAAVTVAMTAATLADDCGGTAPPPAPRAKRAPRDDDQREDRARGARAGARACDQSTMQLSIIAPANASATQLTVKTVELFDDKGVLIGQLTPRTPTIWSQDGTYRAWDQKVTPGQELSVSYALSQPAWGTVTERWNRTYVIKAVVTVGGGDRSVQRDVHIAAPAMLPPNVRT